MFAEWVVRTVGGKGSSALMAINRNSPAVLVGGQIPSEAEPAFRLPRAPQEVTVHGPVPVGTCGTTNEGEAASVAV